MPETIAIVLACLWLVGLLTAVTLDGAIHLLLVAAVGIMLFRIIRGKKPIA